MGYSYAVRDQQGQYFVTFTVHQWVDVFTRPIYVDILLESIRYCQKNKGLQVYAWVIMCNHIHMIISCESGKLSDIIRDLKKYTSSKIVKAIENNKNESRKRWLLWLLKKKDRGYILEGRVSWRRNYQQIFFRKQIELYSSKSGKSAYC